MKRSQYPLYLKEQCSLCRVIKSVRSSESGLLRHAADTERLTGETRYKDVVVRYFLARYLGDLPLRFLTEVSLIALLAKPVPFRAENTPAARLFKRYSGPPDSCEQVNKREMVWLPAHIFNP